MTYEYRPTRRRNVWNSDRYSKASDTDDITAVSDMTDLSFSAPTAKRRARRSILFMLLWAVIFSIWMVYYSMKLSLNDLTLKTGWGIFGPPLLQEKASIPVTAIEADPNVQVNKAPLETVKKNDLVAKYLGRGVDPDEDSAQELRKSRAKPATVLSTSLQQCSKSMKHPELLNEMIYWDKVQPKDYQFTAPNFSKNKFLTFEPDTGGWNSQHLVLESMVVLAFSLGRTLVLPPKRASRNGKLQSYDELMNLSAAGLSKKYKGIRIVTTDEFLKFVAVPGYLKKDKKVVKPPENRINWDSSKDIGNLYRYLRSVGHVPREWDPQTCILGIGKDTQKMKKALMGMWKTMEDRRAPPYHLDFQGKPTPVNAPLVERLREFAADRQTLCTYEGPIEKATLVHIPTTKEGKSLIYSPFYSFIFFEDYKQDLLMKRMVRNEMRYNDDIVCAAARTVEALKLMGGGTFQAFHIRSAAFENAHHDVHEEAPWIVREIHGLLPKNATVFVSTDESDQTFFAPLAREYNIYFASDFRQTYLTGVNPGQLELVQQLICARSETFIGTFYSSFSGYINRMRGYYSTREERDGYEEGTLNSYYHSPTTMKKEMRTYRAIRKPFHFREWPTSWRDIDRE